MPAKKKSKEKGQNITQTVKVVIGEGAKKKKRAYKRRPRKAKLDRGSIGAAPLTGPNTIIGEPYPIPPRIIEVPSYYRISEGATTATGNPPSGGPTFPAIMNPPPPLALMNQPSQEMMQAQKPVPLLMDAPKKKSEEQMRIESIIEAGGLKERSTFYKPYEKKSNLSGVGGTWSQENPLLDRGRVKRDERMAQQPVIEEPLSLQRPEPKQQSREVGMTFDEIYPETINIDMGTAPSESKPIADFLPAEKPKSFFSSVLSGVGSIAKSVAAGAVDTAIGAPPGTTATVATVTKKVIPKRPSWNVSESLQRTYIRKFKVSPEDATSKLNALRVAYPHVSSDEVKKAIRSASSQSDILL